VASEQPRQSTRNPMMCRLELDEVTPEVEVDG
jgi:hypothetical protein